MRMRGAMFMIGLGLAAGSAFAQCGEPQWLESPPVPGVENIGATIAIATLSSGDVIAGGLFTFAGDQVVNAIARWDGHRWHSIAGGLEAGGLFPAVETICPLEGDAFVIGGGFSHAGNVEVSNIALWTGTEWAALDAGMDDGVTDVCVLPNGDLIAVGAFTIAGNEPASYIARYDAEATEWMPMGDGCDLPAWEAAVAPDGTVYIAGEFTSVDGVPAQGLATWRDGAWSAVGHLDRSGIAGLRRRLQPRRQHQRL